MRIRCVPTYSETREDEVVPLPRGRGGRGVTRDNKVLTQREEERSGGKNPERLIREKKKM